MNKFAKIAMYSLGAVLMMAVPAFAQDGSVAAIASSLGAVGAGLGAGPGDLWVFYGGR